MTGPSAIGSENGTPTSMTSAPASSRPLRRSTVPATDGSPAVMYGTNARRPALRSAANRSSIARVFVLDGAVGDLEEIVANADPIALGIFSFDDRAAEVAGFVLVGEIDDFARVQHVA